MSLADVSVKRPTFITCIVLVMLALGLLAMGKLGVDLFPDVTFPVVTITTPYPGAGPQEIENLVTKPLEDEISTLAGIKRLTSRNLEGTSQVIAEFALETDVKFAEQQIRDRVGATKAKLPLDIREPIIRRLDPADQPVISLAIDADLDPSKLYDVADQVVRTKIEQVNQVGMVEIIGGRKREIQVALDRDKLKQREMSVLSVHSRLSSAGENVPSGKVTSGDKDTVFRAIGEFQSLDDIKRTIVSFLGNDVPVTVGEIGKVNDTLKDESSRALVNGKPSLFVQVFRQSGANTIAVVDNVIKTVGKLNEQLANSPGKPKITVVRDTSTWIRANVTDVEESIMIGVFLAVVVVFFFLANGRSTIITGLALPNSLIGAFILMSLAGFSINIMTLLALSLSVGLLIDDAIVVRENIFRHIEMGKPPLKAALEGTKEVSLAVIATTLTVIAVFGPIAFLSGVVGQFFKQFGATICFAMAISLFDALTIAPMLSAYFAGATHKGHNKATLWNRTVGRMVDSFDRFQTRLENKYEGVLKYTLRKPKTVLGASFLIFLGSCASVKFVPKTFLPTQDAGEFAVGLDLPPGTSLAATADVATKVDDVIRQHKEVLVAAQTIGGRFGESETAEFYIRLVPAKQRKMNTSQFKELIRNELKPFAYANPKVKDYDAMGAGQRPFTMNILGNDQKQLELYTAQAFEALKKHKGLKDVDTTYRPGKPEFQVALDPQRSRSFGISTKSMGQELRAQVEGMVAAKFREQGREYDVRVRVAPDQRNLKENFENVYVPNVNMNLVRLADISKPLNTIGPNAINRQDRSRYTSITADIAPGAGLGDVMSDVKNIMEKEVKLPPDMRFAFVGQAENFQELGQSMALAMGFGVLFIFLVLASLYESFVTPFTIMLALPLAICGSLVALAITQESLNIFSMIGMIMLLGVATKNSILLVDYANQLIAAGKDRASALIISGKTRLRPILMTTMALIAGTLPVAMGLNEASRQRTSMGIAIIGGLISSTLLTLIVVPAAFSYIDRFRIWSKGIMRRLSGSQDSHGPVHTESAEPANGHGRTMQPALDRQN